MDTDTRLMLLEEIGMGIQTLHADGRRVDSCCIEVQFFKTRRGKKPFASMDLGDAITALAADVFYYGEFDLRDATRCEVGVI